MDNLFDSYTEEAFRFSAEEVKILMRDGNLHHFKKNEIIYEIGIPNKYVYYLQKGTVKFHTITESGNIQTAAYSKAPSFVGIINLNPNRCSVNFCTALTECEIYTCEIDTFMDHLREYNLVEKMLYFVVGASAHIYTNLNALLSENRINLVDKLRNEQHFSLQETANFLGCSRVHVSRLCKQLSLEKKQ